MTNLVIKRDGSVEPFNIHKIETAVSKAMKSIKLIEEGLASLIATKTVDKLLYTNGSIAVDSIHKTVEDVMMDTRYHNLAREYIVYRVSRMPDIFRKRTNLKPYEYPQLIEYIEAIRHSYWIHTEFNYSSDIQDMKVNMTSEEVSIVKKAMLAISQIEVQVKTFWAKLGDKMPKPEVQAVGITFGESEVRHADAYSNLLEIMGLNKEFENFIEVPAIRKRIAYLEKAIQTPIDNKEYFYNIVLFSMFIENVSLFSQFLIMMSFNKHKNILKGISNAVEATSKEEDIHARFGFEIVNIIKKENPSWWTDEVLADIKTLCVEAFEAESAIIDWIYEDTDLDFLPKKSVIEFLKNRFNQSMKSIGIEPVFTIDKDLVGSTEWFTEEILSTKNIDFFVKRSTAYSKKTKAFTEDDLF